MELGWWVYPLLYGSVMGVDRPDRTCECVSCGPPKHRRPDFWTTALFQSPFREIIEENKRGFPVELIWPKCVHIFFSWIWKEHIIYTYCGRFPHSLSKWAPEKKMCFLPSAMQSSTFNDGHWYSKLHLQLAHPFCYFLADSGVHAR